MKMPKLPDLKAVGETIKSAAKKNAPELLIAFGIGGFVVATVEGILVTPAAMKEMDKKKEELEKEDLTAVEVIQATWKCYLPVLVTATASAACIIGADRIHAKRNAVIATAYTISETAMKDYRAKVKEVIGERKEQEVQNAVDESYMKQHPVNETGVYLTGYGNTLCFDSVTGRYFRCDQSFIQKAEQMMNRRLRDEMYVSINDFYYEINLPPIPNGDDLGWNVDNGWIDLIFGSQLANDGTPCLVVKYMIEPRADYRNLM